MIFQVLNICFPANCFIVNISTSAMKDGFDTSAFHKGRFTLTWFNSTYYPCSLWLLEIRDPVFHPTAPLYAESIAKSELDHDSK